MAERTEAGHDGARWYRVYVLTWVWLLFITLIELTAVAVRLGRGLLIPLLMALSLLKAALIVAYFMHLRYERLNMILAILLPTLFIVVLASGVLPDALNVFHRSR